MYLASLKLKYSLLIGIIVLIQISALYYIGHPFICTCGYVELWHGEIFSSGNSQHITDWYTFSHIIHGFLFYMMLWALFPKSSILQRLMLAVGIEVTWEIFENSEFIMNRYRQTALALDYFGDSILNSVFDTVAMAVGFVMARKLPVWSIILTALLFEVFTGYMVRDNLILNIVTLIHPFEFISLWQTGV